MIHAPADYEEQGSSFLRDIHDGRHKVEREGYGRFPLLPKRKVMAQIGSHRRELLKHVIRM